jgi:hypothetical protein
VVVFDGRCEKQEKLTQRLRGRRETQEHSPFEAQGKQEWLCHRGGGICVADSIDLHDEEWCHDPSTTRPGAPECGAKKMPGRSGRDDN